MMKKNLLWGAVISLCLHTTYGQNLDYLVELGQPMSFGDARFNAMSGSMVAMSGSFSALALNPAGAGLYRQDAFGMDAGLFTSTNRLTGSNTLRGNVTNLNISNFGFLGRNRTSGWNFFFTYNTDQVYRERLRENVVSGGSILSQWINNSDGTPPDFLPELGAYEDLLYQSYATDWDPNSRSYTTTATLADVETSHTYFRRGLRNRWTFGGGKALTQQFYVGASASIVHSYETVEIEHNEQFNSTTDLSNFKLEDYWNNNAIGMTANVGFIYRPLQFLRVASAIELPHIYAFNQDWEVKQSTVRPSVSSSGITAEGYGTDYQWTVVTAPKIRSGATVVVGRSGLISLSHTLVPHAMTSAVNRNERYLNEIVDSLSSMQQQFALGTEIRFGDLSLRAGTGYSPAFQEGHGDEFRYSFGGSLKADGIVFNLSYSLMRREQQYYMYSRDYSNPVAYENQLSFITMGAVWKF